jgi:hypothetical protein
MDRVAAALFVLFFAPIVTAHANMFGPQDTQGLDALRQRILVAQRDNLEVQRSLNQSYAFNALECLNTIDNYLGQFGDEVSFVSTLISISSTMQSQYDESIVNRHLGIEIGSGLMLLPIARRAANSNSALCGSSAIVVYRASVALSLLDEGQRLLLMLNRRF